MIRKTAKLVPMTNRLLARNAKTTTLQMSTTAPDARTTVAQNWDLYASVLVERLPVVSKSLNSLERKFQEQLWRMEFENSLKSNHELKHDQDIIQNELIKAGKIEVDLDDNVTKQTAQDLKDAYTEELKSSRFASRSTADDAANKTTSTDRCLEDSLYLVIEEVLNKNTHRLLPQGPRLDGETMRQAAERVLREKCGTQLKVHFYGNAPCGFFKYKYPAGMRENGIGAKVFFYRAALLDGAVDQTVVKNYEWLTKPALEEKLEYIDYNKCIQKFLL
ncbi:large ribosomal subunit protein mL46 isoform X2 [Eurosta solidaginis]